MKHIVRLLLLAAITALIAWGLAQIVLDALGTYRIVVGG